VEVPAVIEQGHEAGVPAVGGDGAGVDLGQVGGEHDLAGLG
jgi:hypothetical protein